MNITLRSAHGRYLCAEPDGRVVATIGRHVFLGG